MKIIRKDNNIELNHDGNTIETYKLDEAIDFKLLVEFLLKDELSTSYTLEDFVDNPTNAEKDLISLVKDIIDKYNLKKSDFDKFISEK
jgi:hypothetical protein